MLSKLRKEVARVNFSFKKRNEMWQCTQGENENGSAMT